jgi:VCBS repeat-containing protein
VYFSSYDATIEFSAETYPLDSYASVTLADAEENTNHAEAEALLNRVFIRTSAFNFAMMECIETGVDTGTFMGSILVSNAPTEDKKNIQASEGQTLTVSSQDKINTFGVMRIVSDTALVVAAVTATPTATPVSCDVATAITSDSPTVTVTKGDSTEVTITVTGADGCAVVGDTVKATSNNTGIATVSPSKAKTDASGQATFTITGNKKGSAKVTFKEKTANLKTKTTVTVTK